MQKVGVQFFPMLAFRRTNNLVNANVSTVELLGVWMRIVSFGLVSWLGPSSPFMFVWVLNTADAVMLTWCAILRQDRAYALLNGFWILVGMVGVARAAGAL
jgi:hypothetical protein